MYLSNLKLQGFKSFAKKTTMDFNGGVTCVVGPNGCGKSNLVDAVRWVLGEQRTAVLRSEKMESVIFSGSNVAKPLGMAEVSITIENTRNILPIEYSEVVVTRRLYRSGESDYLLNKSPCRLKDIRDLFLDTGVGPDTYSVIELKMVERILSNKSEERLGLFEEAAGINKYKHRRNAAFRKLDATKEDINRVMDIISEVERNVKALKRQVGRAERYQSFKQQIEELEIRAASLEFASIRKKLNPLEEKLSQLERDYQENRSILSREEAELEKHRAAFLSEEEELSTLQNKISAVTDSIYKKENEVVTANERIKATEEKMHRYNEEKGQLKQRMEMLHKRIEEGEPQLGTMGEKIDGLRRKHQLKEQELNEFDKALARRRLDVNEARTRLIELMESISEKEKKRNSLESQLHHLDGRRDQLNGEMEQIGADKEENLREKDELETKKDDLEKTYQHAESQLEKQRQSLRKLQQEAEKNRINLSEYNHQLSTLKQQQSFLKNLIEVNEGYPDGVQYILQNSKGRSGTFGLLADLISVPQKYRVAVEAILGEKAFYVVVRSESDAFEWMRQLRENNLGQVTFLILERVSTIPTSDDELPPKTEGVLGKATQLIKSSKEIQPIVNLLFEDYIITQDTDVWKKMSKDHRWFAATLPGEVMAPEGAVRSGRYESGEKVSSVSRVDQLQEIGQQISDIQEEISGTEQVLKKQNQKCNFLEKEVEKWNEKLKSAEKEYQQNCIHAAQRETSLNNLEKSLQSSHRELENIEKLYQDAVQQIQHIKPELDEFVRKRRRYEDETEALQSKLEELETQRNQLAEETHEINLELVQTTGQQNSLKADIRRMQRTVEDMEKTIVKRDEELKDAEKEIVTLRQKLQENHQELATHKQHKDTLLGDRAEKEKEYKGLQEEISRKENHLKQARQVGEDSVDVLQNLRLEISEKQMRIQNLQESIKEKYDAEVTPIETDNPDELSTIRNKLEALKEKVRLFGPVNLMAIEEYKKESERLSFYLGQKNDLVEAEETLLETIQVINKTARKKFEDIFEQIRDNFRRNFKDFFEGGEGDLRIQFDPDDPLSANILILARPSGKQLGALELLSAGEKALTAISLLFSIYQVKPSPFCVLDEIDAPLDDVNVKRFIRVLKKFSNDTQFIVVTHNKITMEAADYIYGVTMAEEGISKIVSVELHKAHEMV